MHRALVYIGCLFFSNVTFAEAVPADPLPGADRNDCFTITFSKDRRVLDDKRLLIWENGERPYLVVLDRPLKYLSSGGHSITLIDGDGDGLICRTLRDSIFVADTILSKSRKIVAVTKLSSEDMRTLEAAYKRSLAPKKRGQWGSQQPAEPGNDESKSENAQISS